LRWIDPGAGLGLEIGALTVPLLTPALGPVEYADHLPTEALREKYRDDPNIDTDAIVEVHHVIGDRPLPAVTGTGRFHHAVASHVIEHAPDLIGWLEEIRAALRPGGVLSLVIPDKRYTFDVQRQTSSVAAMIDAHLRGVRRPTPQQAFDHFAHIVETDARLPWRIVSATHFRRRPNDPHGLLAAKQAMEGYVDSHCWVFTPASFFDSLRRLAALGLFRFEVIGFDDTRLGEFEFFVSLRAPTGNDAADEAKWLQRVEASIPRPSAA
jgi:SAM-dependent methyltransferase